MGLVDAPRTVLDALDGVLVAGHLRRELLSGLVANVSLAAPTTNPEQQENDMTDDIAALDDITGLPGIRAGDATKGTPPDCSIRGPSSSPEGAGRFACWVNRGSGESAQVASGEFCRSCQLASGQAGQRFRGCQRPASPTRRSAPGGGAIESVAGCCQVLRFECSARCRRGVLTSQGSMQLNASQEY